MFSNNWIEYQFLSLNQLKFVEVKNSSPQLKLKIQVLISSV